jgi:hypothetical protein
LRYQFSISIQGKQGNLPAGFRFQFRKEIRCFNPLMFFGIQIESPRPIPQKKITPPLPQVFNPRYGSVCPVCDDKVSLRKTLKITGLLSRFRIGKPHLLHPQVKQPDAITEPETYL